MYDDTSFYAFVPSASTQHEKPQGVKHVRKTSLLAQPSEGVKANGGLVGGPLALGEGHEEVKGPPKATLSRRAQSYSDFHYAVRAVLEPDRPPKGQSGKGAETLESDLDFTEWFDGLEEELLEASHSEYMAYRDQLEFAESYLGSLSTTTSATIDVLTSLSQSFRSVEAQTTAFQKQCQDLVTEQQRVTRLAEDIAENLQYYNYLEPITRRLNAPGAGNFVRGKEFSDMLERLDECLAYMGAHMSHREAPTYMSRYRLLLTRGLTLIRVNFVGALREISQDVSRRIADKQLNETTMSALLYAKFRMGASELKEVAQEIRKRAIVPSDAGAGAEAEYQSLMNELYTSYSATRGKLVIPVVKKKIAEIAMAPSSSKELVAFARSSIGYTRGICSDEYGLWHGWFEGDDRLYDFLESVCEPLYDHLRPRIIHENQLLKLCELCTLLQTRYMRDQDEEIEMVDSYQLDFSSLIQSALEDAQTRLVFRTQAILRDEIENYKPKPEDLDYPARNRKISLSGTKTNGQVTSGRKGSGADLSTPLPRDPVIVDEDDSLSARFGFDTEAAFQGWYPTLRKAVWLLSRIYRLVNSTVFDDLAHQIVHQTTLSLYRASALIAGRATSMDGQLFLLKHLLVLKQQIVAFDIEFVTPDVSFDFSGVSNTFYELRDRGGLFDPRNLWRFVGGGLLPRVIENMLDAKVELDGRLRTVINDFTTTSAERMTHPIGDAARNKKSFEAASGLQKTQQLTVQEVPFLRRKLDEYLDDVRTKETLVGAVQSQVLMNYESFYDSFADGKRAIGAKAGNRGKGREGDVWDVDTFAEWADEVFGVRGIGSAQSGVGGSRSDSGSRGASRAIPVPATQPKCSSVQSAVRSLCEGIGPRTRGVKAAASITQPYEFRLARACISITLQSAAHPVPQLITSSRRLTGPILVQNHSSPASKTQQRLSLKLACLAMASKAYCLYCFEVLAASLEEREALSLVQVEDLWANYNDSKETTSAGEGIEDEADDDDEVEMTENDEEVDEEGHEDDDEDGDEEVDDNDGTANANDKLADRDFSLLRPKTISRLQNVSPASGSSSSTPSTLSTTSSRAALGDTSKSSSNSSFFSFTRKSQRTPAKKFDEYPLFVTWNTISPLGHKSLRGCIGTFEALELPSGLKSYALTAAFDDTRFAPITLSTLPTLACSITLLTNFVPCATPLDWDLDTHGIRIAFSANNRRYSATYLPDVAVEQGWDKEETIVSLMRKAGWSGRTRDWSKVGDLRVTRYEGLKASAGYGEWRSWRKWVDGRDGV